MQKKLIKALVAIGASVALLGTSACQSGSLGNTGGGGAAGSGGAKTTIKFLNTNDSNQVALSQALVKAFNESQDKYVVQADNSRPGGGEGDNIVKTRLSTGEMAEVFVYNSGSLMQAIKPEQNLVPLDDQGWMKDVREDFLKATVANGKHYGAPFNSGGAGGVMYNKKVYADLGLQVPKTWAEFMANNAKIKAAGKTAVIQSYAAGSTWTSQLFMLGDYHNVVQADPDWATKYTNNQAKYVNPPALAGFQHTEDVFKAGYINADAPALTSEQAVAKLASGEGVHYPILSGLIDTVRRNHADKLNDIGFFGIPGTDAAKAGLTTWVPNAMYIPKTATGAKLEAAKAFVSFVNSTPGCKVLNDTLKPTGAYGMKNCALPSDVPQAVKDVVKYSDDNKTTPALEFASPVKGPNLEQIIITVGTGQSTAAAAAARYDEDVKKQAQQLGLPGW
ncbi:MAG TPA: ABC transporter substrate-binding protein [Propionibacteriaceae bacterium]|nr:ABC transporter substrate-binding protein [Propionibacteriaceae bacterium]